MTGSKRDAMERLLWSTYSVTYDGLRNFYPYRLLVWRVVQRCASEVSAPHAVVELGCGTGNVLQALGLRWPGASITGVDSSKAMCRRARAKTPAADVVLADALHYLRSCDDNSIPLVVMTNSLYAVPNRLALWTELLRVLEPDGAAVITNSDRPGSAGLVREHLRNARSPAMFDPRLLFVGLIDMAISRLARSGTFAFASVEVLRAEVSLSGGCLCSPERCYGGVNVLFAVRKKG